ncbi:MAG: hypothetical protein MJ175_06275 [Clostridia bacterium]|nr:hypothetical protein [Clostridia bacterium]
MKSNKKHLYFPTAFLIVLSAAAGAFLSGCSFIEIHKNPGGQTVTEAVTTAPVTEAPVITEAPDETIAPPEDDEAPIPADPASIAEKKAKAEGYLKGLRRDNFGGMNFLIAAADSSAAFGMDADGVTLRCETMNTIREERMKWVEDKYNARILTFSYNADDLYKEVYNAYLSDSQYVADFFAIPAKDLGRYQKNGLLMNMRSLPFTDYSAPYYNKRAMQQMSAGYGIWGAAGAYTEAPENYYGIYFNKKLAATLGLASPYDLVRSGEWTWDIFYDGAKTAMASADGVYGDNLGVFSLDRAEQLVFGSSGLHPAVTSKDTTPNLNVVPERMQTMADLIYNSVHKGNTSPDASQSPDALFDSGKLLYLAADLSAVPRRADISVDWGIVPLPKAYAGQKNYFSGTGDLSVLCAPAVAVAPEKTGTILQALFAASYGAYNDVFVNDALLYSVRDNDTIEMLDLILGSTSYDFSAMFASGYPALSAATVGGLHQTITSIYSFDRLYRNNQQAALTELRNAFPTE